MPASLQELFEQQSKELTALAAWRVEHEAKWDKLVREV